MVVATYIKLLLKNIGGSEKFGDKKKHLYSKLKGKGINSIFPQKTIRVKRDAILKDVSQRCFIVIFTLQYSPSSYYFGEILNIIWVREVKCTFYEETRICSNTLKKVTERSTDQHKLFFADISKIRLNFFSESFLKG